MSSKLSTKKQKVASNKHVKAGLGGWLIIVGLGLILGLLLGIYGLWENLNVLPIIDSVAISGFKYIFYIETLVQVIYLVISIYLLNLFFKKRKNFPKYYSLSLYSMICWALISYLMYASLPMTEIAHKEILGDILYESLRDLFKIFTSSMIWIIYMHKSKRVKATFVN